ncbi:MAG: hypothetical protein AAF376_11615 [Pseudomonadota bacterium]
MAGRLFLERRTYRRNRLQDAARLLPILGVVLIFAPVFIRDSEAVTAGSDGTGLEQWIVYYFVIWIGLIALTAVVSRALTRTEEAESEGDIGAGGGTEPGDQARHAEL